MLQTVDTFIVENLVSDNEASLLGLGGGRVQDMVASDASLSARLAKGFVCICMSMSVFVCPSNHFTLPNPFVNQSVTSY